MNKSVLAPIAALTAVIALLSGCASPDSKSKPVPQPEKTFSRGWIGVHYELVTKRGFFTVAALRVLPAALTNHYRSALLVTALGSNSPAALAGLRPGDLILEVNHQPVEKLDDLRLVSQSTEPGASLSLAAWRDGQSSDCNVTVGRETYAHQGSFTIMFPFHAEHLDLWPDPGFSLWLAGYQPGRHHGFDLSSVKDSYLRKYGVGKHEPYEDDWRAWLVILELQNGKKIISQEIALSAPSEAATNSPAIH